MTRNVALAGRERRVTGRPDEEGLIRGVIVHPLTLHPDDRGHFAEVFRADDPVAAGFEFRQSSITRTRAGVVKAFHWHHHQDDIFCPLVGTARIALVDFRKDSETYGVANSVFAGELYAKAVRIPAGVAHIKATFNNTIISITDMRGGVVSWSSAGRAGFKGSRKSTAFAATVVGQDAGRQAAAAKMIGRDTEFGKQVTDQRFSRCDAAG